VSSCRQEKERIDFKGDSIMSKNVIRRFRAILAGLIISGATLFAAPAGCSGVDAKDVLGDRARFIYIKTA